MAIDLDVHGNTKPLEAAVQAAVNRIRRQPIKITVDDKGATQPLGNMKRGADEFAKSMEAANARILAFGASMAIINGVANAFKGMVKNLVEVEKSLADINVVMGLSAQNLDKFSDGLFKVAKETGAAFKVAADAATEYARQGLGVEESLKRTRDALVLTRLTGMDSAEAVKSLTAAMNTYGNQIKDTTQLVSKFAAVDVKFAVSAEDFADAISRTGQSAKTAGVSIDELVGIVTSAQQQTARGGAVIGNALKTIFTKTGRTDTLNQLENLGIAVRDLEGNTLGAKRILSDLANTFDKLSEAQKAQITQTMGGLFHINILKAVLSDAAKQNGIMAEATRISAGATDEAIEKNEELRKTMSAVATETGLAIKQVSAQIGEIALAPGMEKILNSVKSLAEGLSNVLGDGETTGSSFATGFLKGIGNVITGPGLVVLAGVFFKLFGQALKFTKESLTSLVGVTTEKQKQKAIQTSLVALFGQNAALNKEMLRTDIGRTEKEKIILGLLKAQVVEANALNKLTAGMAGTLYRKGYGANLTPVGKKASGHIPNFAHPERAQAAQGGYAAGSIRSMNMPGEGPVIYNSAETVKNFAGFKQPAIMPPQSSKAGKNYQQAFGNIHGFDPYAAGGYIPNFIKPSIKLGDRSDITTRQQAEAAGYSPAAISSRFGKGTSGKTTVSHSSDVGTFDLNQLFPNQIKSMGVLLGFGREGSPAPQQYKQTYNSLPAPARNILNKKLGIKKPSKATGKKSVIANLPTKAVYEITDSDTDNIEQVLGKSTLEEKLYNYVGVAFDKFSHAIGIDMFGGKIGKAGTNVLKTHMDGSLLGNLFEAAVRGSLDNKKVKDSQAPFDFMGSNAENISKFMGEDRLSLIEGKYSLAAAKSGGIPKKILNYIAGSAANGFIPNFANPLSDAIGREKAAGVPVSQIRVGSHGALMSKGNPLGLGVTNTHDEPNGLRDVFGANGFVPNYAAFNFTTEYKAGRDEYRAAAELQKQINEENKKLLAEKRKLSIEARRGADVSSRLNAIDSQLATNKQNFSAATKMAADATRQMGIAGRAGGAIQNIRNINQRFSEGAIGRGLSGGGGMGLMIGAPMLAGYLQSGGAAEGGFGYKAGGALMGAGTGASMGMIFGPLGIAVGSVVGAIAGWTGALNESKEAIKEEKIARSQEMRSLAQVIGKDLVNYGSFAGNRKLNFAGTSLNLNPKGFKMLTNQTGLGMKKYGGASFLKNIPIEENPFLQLRAAMSEKGSGFNLLQQRLKEAGTKGGPGLAGNAFGDQGQNLLSRFFSGGEYQAKHLNEAFKGTVLEGRGAKYSKILQHVAGLNKEERKAYYEQKGIEGGFEGYSGMSIENISPLIQKDYEEAMSAGFRRENLKSQFGQLPEDYSFKFRALKDSSKYKKGQERTYTKKEFLREIEGLSDQDIKDLDQDLVQVKKDISKEAHKQKQAIILQLNLQKAQIKAQKAASDAQLDIKSKFLEQSSLLDSQEKLLSGFMSEEQKVRIKYNKSLLKASEVYESGAAQAASAFKTGILQDITQNPALQSALKQELFKGEDASGKTLMDLTSKLSTMDALELEATLERIGVKHKEANEILTNRGLIYKNQLDTLEQQQNLSSRQSEIERDLNMKIAERKSLMEDVNHEMQSYISKLSHAAKLRAISSEISTARFNAGPARTQEGRFIHEQGEVLNRQRDIEERFEEEELNKLKGYGDKLGLSLEQRKQILKDPSRLTKISSDSIKDQESKLKSYQTDKDTLRTIIEDKKSSGRNAQEEEFTLQQIIYLEQSISDAKKEQKKESERITKELKQRLKEKDAEIAKEQTLLDIQRQEYARKTGPGAFGEGMKDAGVEMREQVKMMDYELGKKIPQHFADGMAQAMNSALNGTQKLGDSLRDVAISFLQMMQQAFLQKAAYQMVGAMGFSRGGNVRRYSNGGGVPAKVSDGEYLMSREAVARYGGSFMHNLNAGGKIPGFSNGGTTKYKSGRKYQSKQMSGFFYSGQAGNVGLEQDKSDFMDLLRAEEAERQRKAREAEMARMKAAQAAAAKKARKRALWGSIAGAALSFGIGKITSGLFSPKPSVSSLSDSVNFHSAPTFGKSQYFENNLNTNFPASRSFGSSSVGGYSSLVNNTFGSDPYDRLSYGVFGGRYLGGPIRRYNDGGYISGKSGIDQIPAMLSEGEYVIRASSARQIGKPMLDDINAGRFNDGGMAGDGSIGPKSSESQGENNINITVNIENGKVSGEQQDAGGQRNQNEMANSFSRRLKDQVLIIIQEEQRAGGLLG